MVPANDILVISEYDCSVRYMLLTGRTLKMISLSDLFILFTLPGRINKHLPRSGKKTIKFDIEK